MSLLETFFIMFESNADEVEKGSKKAEKSTDDLEKKLNSTDRAALKLGQSFTTMVKAGVASLTAGLTAGAIVAGAITQAAHIDMLRQTSERLNVNIGEWHAWSRAVVEFGGDAGTLEGTLRGLSANLSVISIKGNSGISPFLSKLGVRVRKANGEMKTSLELLPDLAKAFEGMSSAQVQGVGAKLGIDGGTLLMLMKGRRAVEEYIQKQKELGVVTEKQGRIAQAYNLQLNKTKESTKMLFANISEYVLPVLELFFRGIEKGLDWINKYGREITVFAGIISLALYPVLIKAGVAAWSFAAGIWAAIAPFLPFIAAAAAVALVLGDLWAYFTGAPSAIGYMIDAFKSAVPAIKQAFAEWGEYAIGVVKSVLEWLHKLANIVTFGGFDKAMEGIGKAKDFVIQASQSGMNAQPVGSIAAAAGIGTQSRTVSIGEVKVETQATDADGISKAIGQTLSDEMNRTLNNYDDGIRG